MDDRHASPRARCSDGSHPDDYWHAEQMALPLHTRPFSVAVHQPYSVPTFDRQDCLTEFLSITVAHAHALDIEDAVGRRSTLVKGGGVWSPSLLENLSSTSTRHLPFKVLEFAALRAWIRGTSYSFTSQFTFFSLPPLKIANDGKENPATCAGPSGVEYEIGAENTVPLASVLPIRLLDMRNAPGSSPGGEIACGFAPDLRFDTMAAERAKVLTAAWMSGNAASIRSIRTESPVGLQGGERYWKEEEIEGTPVPPAHRPFTSTYGSELPTLLPSSGTAM
ncbi:hypothetical protein EV421DRAFT_1742458 [Armillaria borealis]|uniref:Uncharacterized protein n=1 Tax=Armillaria borealis TaxID=47425 RepID=A0AA39MFE6_9AGAR|nr:hypothetical protein EV421DRAFT_1742458 [Armillaria borealis]